MLAGQLRGGMTINNAAGKRGSQEDAVLQAMPLRLDRADFEINAGHFQLLALPCAIAVAVDFAIYQRQALGCGRALGGIALQKALDSGDLPGKPRVHVPEACAIGLAPALHEQDGVLVATCRETSCSTLPILNVLALLGSEAAAKQSLGSSQVTIGEVASALGLRQVVAGHGEGGLGGSLFILKGRRGVPAVLLQV